MAWCGMLACWDLYMCKPARLLTDRQTGTHSHIVTNIHAEQTQTIRYTCVEHAHTHTHKLSLSDTHTLPPSPIFHRQQRIALIISKV